MARTHIKIGLVGLQFINGKIKFNFPKYYTETDCIEFKKYHEAAIKDFAGRFVKETKITVKKVESKKQLEETDKEIIEKQFEKIEEQLNLIISLESEIENYQLTQKTLTKEFEAEKTDLNFEIERLQKVIESLKKLTPVKKEKTK